jgi:hypothetical protein
VIRLAAVIVLASLGAGCGPPAACEPRPGHICRVAGNGERAFNGDGRAAADTAFYLASAVRLGPDGRAYVMDFNNMRLRVVGDDGTVATVAGNGLHYFASTGVPATESPMENPIDFAFAPDGTLVLVSLHDPRVFTIEADGILRAVAGSGEVGDVGDGGPAINARFVEVHGVAVGADGAIYVADGGAHRVRVVRPEGTIDAFAGTGEPGHAGDGGPATEASLQRPSALTLGPDGALYIADTGNAVVRRVGADGVITTVAGNGERGYAGDGGPATGARLRTPEGVAVAADGTLYIADWNDHRIRRVGADGTITTIAGGGAPGITGDGGPGLDATLAGPARLSLHRVTGPDGAALDALYIADQINSCARVLYLE